MKRGKLYEVRSLLLIVVYLSIAFSAATNIGMAAPTAVRAAETVNFHASSLLKPEGGLNANRMAAIALITRAMLLPDSSSKQPRANGHSP